MRLKILGWVTAGLLALISVDGHAALITISGSGDTNIDGQWEISTLTGTFADHEATLTDQLWFSGGGKLGDTDLAYLFAETLGGILGDPGPLFATTESAAGVRWRDGSVVGVKAIFQGEDIIHTFAIAARVQVSEPSTVALLILGLGLAGMFARRRNAH